MTDADVDDWAKEECACGHLRHSHEHGTGPCLHTRKRRRAPDGLSEPVFAEGCGPFDAPINWPPYEQWPEVEQPCCTAFLSAAEEQAEWLAMEGQ